MAWVGRRLHRLEDGPLLTGRASFLPDLTVPGMLHAALVRSPVPHGQVRGFTAPDGVTLALGPADVAARVRGELAVLWRLGDQAMTSTPVVDGRARYVGQPLGVVVAPDPEAARLAAAAAVLDIDPLPAVLDPVAAMAPGAPLLHPHLGTNVLCTVASGDDRDTVARALAGAERVLRTTLAVGRVSGTPLEGRGCLAVPGPDGKLTVWLSSQAPHAARDALCDVLGLPQHRVRVISPHMGGGFGLKDHLYEDEVMVVLAALELGRPVRWTEERTETLLGTTHARDESYEVAVGYDDDGRLVALDVVAVRNAGSHLSIFGGGPLFAMAATLPGPYRWDAVRGEGRVVATTTTPTGAYRGFGQTQSAYVRERAVDLVAAALAMDPFALRRRNLLAPDELPYTTRTFLTYDTGRYAEALDRAEALVLDDGVPGDGPPDGPPAGPNPDDGRARGVGVAMYVHLSGVGPSAVCEMLGLSIGGYETTRLVMERDATVRLYTGTSPHGQGQPTTFAQLVADRLGITPDAVEVIASDTDVTPYSAYGTAASRSMAVGGGASVLAADRLAETLRTLAGDLLEADPRDVVLADGRATVAGTSVGLDLRDLAAHAWRSHRRPPGLEPGLHALCAYDPESATFSYAVHACRVAVDRETGHVRVERYVVVNDCGTVVNPTIVEGQVHGGVAQGLGAALLEEMTYRDDGEPVTATLLDYLVPTADVMPSMIVEHLETPSPYTPGGMKGMGEGGTNGAFAAVANAVAAALPEAADRLTATPYTPERIWRALRDAAG